ncbi:MAG: SRPBCC family protein [Anaerolineae bacterium]|nr:SRPBCC family protein [Anaerolineae bacterium]
MGTVEAGTIIHAPVKVVWDCLNDIDHTPEWVVGLVAAEIVTSGTYGEGSVYHDHNRLGPFLQTTPWTVTAFESLAHQVHESDSAALPSKMTLNVSPDPEGTYLEMIVEYRLLPRLGVVSRLLEQVLMNRMLKQVLKQNQANLNAYLTQQISLSLQPASQ